MNSAHNQAPQTAVPLRVRNKRNLCEMAMTLLNPKIQALLDSGCSWDFINSVLVLGMGLTTKPLKETFEQMDGSSIGGTACDYKTEISMGMRKHWELDHL